MTDPQVPFQSDPPTSSQTPIPTQSAATRPPSLIRAVGPFGAVGLYGGELVTLDHKGIGAMAAKAHHVEFPVTAIGAVDLVEPTVKNNGRLDLTVHTTEGDRGYDPKKPNQFSMTFTASHLDEFKTMAEALDAARPANPIAIEPPKPERGKPFWKSGAFWGAIILVVVFCWLVNSCGAADDSATQSMPNVVGLSYDQARQAFEDYHNVDYVDAKGSPVMSGAVTGQKPKEGTKISHSTEITVTVDPLGKTREQKAREAAEEKDRQLRQQASGYKGQDAGPIINDLEGKRLLGAVRIGEDASDKTDAVKNGIAAGTPYTVTDASVDNGTIDLKVDTTAHYIREQATQQIPGLCETAGKRMYPYGFKVPIFSTSGDVTFTDDTHWSYPFEANITNAFGATAKRTPVTCTGTLNGQNIEVTGVN